MKVRLLDEAEQDLEDGQAFFERQSPGLGGYFVRRLLEDLRALRTTAGIHAIEHGYFRAISERFPYKIYYKVEGTYVMVVAIVDSRRDPAAIRDDLTNRQE